MGKRETLRRTFAPTLDEMREVIALQNGADIFDFGVASRLRVLDAKYPGLLLIVRPQHKFPGKDRQPYFGCILNPLASFHASVPMEAHPPALASGARAEPAPFSMLGGSVARGGV